MAREHLEREAHAVLERAAVLVRAPVGQRRDEAREQIAVRAVQFEHVEAGALAALGRRARTPPTTAVHVGAGHLARHLAVRDDRERRRPRSAASRLRRAAGPSPPTSAWSRPCGRHGRAAGRSSSPNWRARNRRCASRPPPARRSRGRRSRGVMRASASDAGHLGEHQPGAADARARRNARGASRPARRPPREYWHIGETTTRLSSIMPRSRNGWNIGGTGLSASTVEALRRASSRATSAVDLATNSGRAQREIVVGDRLGARHQAEGELHRVGIVPVAPHVLEPDQRHVGGVLRLLHLLAPRRFRNARSAAATSGRRGAEGLVERDRVLHRELGAGADGEVRRRLGVADQHQLPRDPALAADRSESCARSSGW